jgi:magnesium chelatase family protein
MNPSPDGNYYLNNSIQSFHKVQKYLSKLSKPLLDRIDLQIEVDAVEVYEIVDTKNNAEKSSAIKKRVEKARKVQLIRQNKTNAQLNSSEIKIYCSLGTESMKLLKNAALKMNFSVRGITRIQKTSRTIADLDNSKNIMPHHIAEALQYRGLDKLKAFLN